MSRQLPVLGFDPTPGDVGASRAVAQTTTSAAEALHEIAAVLAGSTGGEWRGQAAIAFRELLDDDFRPKVDKAARAFDQAARVLHRWTAHMEDVQRQAARLEARAQDADDRARTARTLAGQVYVPDVRVEDPTSVQRRDEEVERRRGYERRADAADGDLASARSEARRLQEAYEAAGQTYARELQRAVDMAPDEPGFWDKLGADVVGALDRIADAVGDLGDWATSLLESVAPILNLIGKLAEMLSIYAGILALFPALTPIMAPAALFLGGLALGASTLGEIGDSGSFAEAVFNRDFATEAAGLAVGFGVCKYGKTLTRSVYRAARASGNTYRVVRDASTGRRMHVPLTFFDAVRRSGYTMRRREALWRGADASVKGVDKGFLLIEGVGRDLVGGRLDPIPKLVTGTYGPFLSTTPALSR